VHYGKKETAIADGYTEFSSKCVNGYGVVHPFTGIRGDAKQLWRNIRNNTKKNNICLVKCPEPEKQKEELSTSDVVIWACGYESKHVPIKVSQDPLNKKY